MDVKIIQYGNYKTNNYGSAIAVRLGHLTLYFSYETVIAFKHGCEFYICENIWSNTTGRHLNSIDPDKSKRIPYKQFEDKLKATLQAHEIEV